VNLHARPILSALLRNGTGAALVAVQVAIALAVLVNATYIAVQRVEKIGRPTGIDVDNIFVIESDGFTKAFRYVSAIQEDLAYLRSLSGVTAAAPFNAVPMGGGGNGTELTAKPNDPLHAQPGNHFETDERGLDTLGLRLVAGRGFGREEILPPLSKQNTGGAWVPQIILTKALAAALFPQENPLGKPVYDNLGRPATIIGIVEEMQGAWINWSHGNYVFLMPRLPADFNGGDVYYLVRTQPGRGGNALMRTVEDHLAASNPNRLVQTVRPLQDFKDFSYQNDRNMAIFLVTVTGLLLGIASLGIFGLATFNVSIRTKQIGTRRAVGARKGDIVRYFMVESALITTAGILLGCALALGIGYWLSVQYELPRLDLHYLVGGVLLLWTIGQLAAWYPARRAAAVAPSVATRTV
jgi:putative ABC transport system permease protein